MSSDVPTWLNDYLREDESDAPKDLVPGGSNEEFLRDRGSADRSTILDVLENDIMRTIIGAGEVYGYSPASMESAFSGLWNYDGALGRFDEILTGADVEVQRLVNMGIPPEDLAGLGYGSDWLLETPDGYNYLKGQLLQFYGARLPFDLGDALSKSTRGSGRGRGSSAITAQDIRDQFDIDALSEKARQIWHGMLIEDPNDPRGIAREYVEAVAATLGQKKIDFTQFVRKRAKATARHASIYRNMPEGMMEEAYLQTYLNNAMQAVRPQNAADIAIGGAQLGASPDAFRARLRRSEDVQSSSRYVNELGARIEGVSSILRG